VIYVFALLLVDRFLGLMFYILVDDNSGVSQTNAECGTVVARQSQE